MKRHFIPLFAMYLVCLLSLLSCQSDQFNRELVLPHSQIESSSINEHLERSTQCESLGRIAFANCGILVKVGLDLTIDPISESEFPVDLEDGELVRLTYFLAEGYISDCPQVLSARVTCMRKINNPATDELINSTL